MSKIHPSTVIEDGAIIGENCEIGPFCYISSTAVIGAGTYMQSHVFIGERTTLGKECRVFAFASVGNQSQDLKWKPENRCYTTIGDNTIIRENVTVHSGTDDETYTRIGSNCALLALSHVGHNCEVGDDVVVSHNATLGGHVIVEDHCNIGGLSAIHQFCRIGKGSMIAGMARVIQDILPFTIAEGEIGRMRIVNKIGMARNGYSDIEIRAAQDAFKILFMRDLTVEEATKQLQDDFSDSKVVGEILRVIELSTRGLARPVKKRT